MHRNNTTNKFKENFTEFTNNAKFGELIDRKFHLMNNVIKLQNNFAGEEFLKFDGKSILVSIFIYIQQIPECFLLNFKIAESIYQIISSLLNLTILFFKDETFEINTKNFDIIYCYLQKFLDKVSIFN